MRIFRLLLLVLIVLAGCGPSTPTMTVNELLGSIDNTQINIVKFVEFNTEYVIMELNGKRYQVMPDSLYIENEAYLVTFNEFGQDQGEPFFYTKDPFKVIDWEWEQKINPSMEYYIFRDYTHGVSLREPTEFNPMDEVALGFVLIPIDKMPKVVDWKTWVGTEAKIWVWEYPHRFPWVVQNLTTNEVAFFTGSVVARDSYGEVIVVPDSFTSYGGNISVEEDGTGWPVIRIDQAAK